jgi:hypothetical protein
MSRPYALLVRFKQDGTVAGASAQYIETVNGRDYELDPVPLAEGGSEFAAFATAFSASVVAQRDELLAELADLQQQMATLTQQFAAAQQQVATLTLQLAAEQQQVATLTQQLAAAEQGDSP